MPFPLPLALSAACSSERRFIGIPDPIVSSPTSTTFTDLGSNEIPVTTTATFPLAQALNACLIPPTICPTADCTDGVIDTSELQAEGLVASAAELPPDQFRNDDDQITIEDILANRAAMTVLDAFVHDAPIVDEDWNGNEWSRSAGKPRHYEMWIALGDHTTELAEIAPFLLDPFQWKPGFQLPETLPFDVVQCSAYFYAGDYLPQYSESLSPFQGVTIKSFYFSKNEIQPFPILLDGVEDILPDFEPQLPEEGIGDSAAVCWYTIDGSDPGECDTFFAQAGDDLTESIAATRQSANAIRDASLNPLGLTAYSESVDDVRVVYQQPVATH